MRGESKPGDAEGPIYQWDTGETIYPLGYELPDPTLKPPKAPTTEGDQPPVVIEKPSIWDNGAW